MCTVLDLEKFAAEYAEEFVVVRTSGVVEKGWRMTSVTHVCQNNRDSRWAANHSFMKGVWSVHMASGHNCPLECSACERETDEKLCGSHCCGFRRIGTFWPVRLDDDEEGKKVWSAALVEKLEKNAAEAAEAVEAADRDRRRRLEDMNPHELLNEVRGIIADIAIFKADGNSAHLAEARAALALCKDIFNRLWWPFPCACEDGCEVCVFGTQSPQPPAEKDWGGEESPEVAALMK